MISLLTQIHGTVLRIGPIIFNSHALLHKLKFPTLTLDLWTQQAYKRQCASVSIILYFTKI